MKCDPRAYAKCPTKQYCAPSADGCEFVNGSECDQFNRKVLSQPMTNADRIRAMSDEELAENISEFLCSIEDGVEYHNSQQIWLEWLQQPAEEG